MLHSDLFLCLTEVAFMYCLRHSTLSVLGCCHFQKLFRSTSFVKPCAIWNVATATLLTFAELLHNICRKAFLFHILE